MCLRGAQILERGEATGPWADFGRFDEHRVIPILDRMFHEPSFAKGVLRGFDETSEVFFGKLQARLNLIRRECWGSGGGYLGSSLRSYEPR